MLLSILTVCIAACSASNLAVGSGGDPWTKLGLSHTEIAVERHAAKQGLKISSYFRPENCALPNLSKNGDKLSMQYTGWLLTGGKKGKKFDSSRNPGRTAFGFTLGSGQVIKVGLYRAEIRTLF
jgi:hypothetical protein